MNTWAKAILVAAALAALSGCKRGPETKRVGREFHTTAECLDLVRADTKEQLQVITDKPGDVSGTTRQSKLFFRCETKVTGTKGVFVSGRWDRLK